MNNYDITIRIDEYGFHLCCASIVKQEFGAFGVYYNHPFESVPVELTRGEWKMIYRFRSEHPVIAFSQ
jgi:hypothetical protein